MIDSLSGDPAVPRRLWAVDPTERFAQLVRGPEEALVNRFDEATLLIAAHAKPGLDIGAYRRRLDDLAASCGEPRLAAIVRQLFIVEGFRGNEADYEDPRNSYLDEVLDRRLGIPITLSVVLLEVARRLGMPMAGVSMPGHFLVRLPGDPAVMLDAFRGGVLLSESDCQQRFHDQHGPDVPWNPSYLDPVGPREMLARMLANLRTVHLQRQNSVALEWVLRLRSLLPGTPPDDREERAGVLAALAQFDQAATLLEDLAGEATNERAGTLTSRARRLRARLN